MADLPPLSGNKLALLTFALSLGIFMNVLDISFAVSQAIMLPITGWLARRFGEVRLFLLSTALFTLASILCGLSENLTMLIAFRVLQGAVSGPMIPLSQSILLANYPEHRKGFATSIWAMTAVVGPIFGPILGGWITDNYTWPWIFYINVPVGIISVVLTSMMLTGRETSITKSPIDIVGLGLLIIGVGCLQILLDKGNDLDWFHSNFILTLGITSFIALSFLIIWELTDNHPIIDLRLFAKRNFCLGTIALTMGYLVYFSNVVIFPLWLQLEMGYTPTWAGLAAAPVGILPFLLSPFVGLYMSKFDLRMIITTGFIVFSITSFWQANFYTDVGFDQLIAPRFVQGLGITFFFTPLITIVISELPKERIANALGLANFCRILGGSFGTSISVTMWDRREAFHHSRLVENINAYNPVSTAAVQQLHANGFNGLSSMAVIERTITNQAFMLATDDIFWLSAWTFLSLILVIWLAKPPFMTTKIAVAAE
jgi:DHA2 family multidrug resistance protein